MKSDKNQYIPPIVEVISIPIEYHILSRSPGNIPVNPDDPWSG